MVAVLLTFGGGYHAYGRYGPRRTDCHGNSLLALPHEQNPRLEALFESKDEKKIESAQINWEGWSGNETCDFMWGEH